MHKVMQRSDVLFCLKNVIVDAYKRVCYIEHIKGKVKEAAYPQ